MLAKQNFLIAKMPRDEKITTLGVGRSRVQISEVANEKIGNPVGAGSHFRFF